MIGLPLSLQNENGRRFLYQRSPGSGKNLELGILICQAQFIRCEKESHFLFLSCPQEHTLKSSQCLYRETTNSCLFLTPPNHSPVAYLRRFQEKKYTFFSISLSNIFHLHKHLHFGHAMIKSKHSLRRMLANADVMSELSVGKTKAEGVLRLLSEETVCSTRIAGCLEGWCNCI